MATTSQRALGAVQRTGTSGATSRSLGAVQVFQTGAGPSSKVPVFMFQYRQRNQKGFS